MENYQKVDTKRYSVPPEPHEIRVASRLAIKDIVSRAVEFLEDAEQQKVLLCGQGPTVTRAITCAEILKRRHPELQQMTSIESVRVDEIWKAKDPSAGLDDLKVERQLPAIKLLLSLAPLDSTLPGYQGAAEAGSRPKRPRKSGRKKANS